MKSQRMLCDQIEKIIKLNNAILKNRPELANRTGIVFHLPTHIFDRSSKNIQPWLGCDIT